MKLLCVGALLGVGGRLLGPTLISVFLLYSWTVLVILTLKMLLAMPLVLIRVPSGMVGTLVLTTPIPTFAPVLNGPPQVLTRSPAQVLFYDMMPRAPLLRVRVVFVNLASVAARTRSDPTSALSRSDCYVVVRG